MASMHANPKSQLMLGPWAGKLAGALAGTRSFLGFFEELAIKQAEKALSRILGIAVIYLSLLAGIILSTIGAIFLVVDFTVIPRGIAFALGGLFLASVSMCLLKWGKR